VAEQEEAIKELRVVADADRTKKSTVILAEGQAEEKLITEVKAAEAMERKARHRAAEEITLADAKLKVAERHAEASKREAEGMEALAAAPGLAAAKVTTVTADANEKQGMAEVHIRAAGAEASLKEGQADAQVIELRAHAEATGLRAKLEAEAVGKEKLGLADVNVKLADASALVKTGEAEAKNIEVRFQAEAKGLKDKFEAMSAMSGETRAHEEFRMRLEKSHVETVKGIDAQTSIAREQAEVLGAALANAKIDIVGGEGDYFDRFVGALSVGKGIDGVINKSQTLQVAFKDQLTGERDVIPDLRDLLGALGGSAGELQNLTVAAFAAKVMQGGEAHQKTALQNLVQSMSKP
jgi:hypothetical protein